MSQELIQEITSAFKNVKLCGGISLNMTEYNDSGGTEESFLIKSQFDEKDDWSKIPDEVLEKFMVTFSFTDVKGFRFYIAAYMIWSINNLKTSQSIIGDFTIYALDPNHYVLNSIGFENVFSSVQIMAIIKFLEFSVENGDYCDGAFAEKNLDKINKYLKKS